MPVSVVVPTLGRASLAACLRSLRDCRPLPGEVLVVAQGQAAGLEELAARAGPPGVRVVRDSGFGVSRNRNLGLRLAAHAVVAVTDDDCTVQADWIARAFELAREHPDAILTGRVLPVGDPDRVPSWKDEPEPHDFSGEIDTGALYPNNMVLPRDRILAFGGFDERFRPSEFAEDCDLAYRWLRAGLPLRYEPGLVVHHHDWRTDEELERLYVLYGRGLGALYAKHLREGDREILRFLRRDVRLAVVALLERLRRRDVPPRWPHGLPVGLPLGLLYGFRHLPPGSPWGVRRDARAARRRAPA